MKRLLLACILLGVVIVACKQGKGDRCQIDDDCAGTGSQMLVCNKATNTCQEEGGNAIDATVPDAPPAPEGI